MLQSAGLPLWESIRFVTGWFTLVAFVAAAGLTYALVRLHKERRLLEALPPEDRSGALEKITTHLRLRTENLTREQTYNLAARTLHNSQRKFDLAAKFAFAALLTFGVLWLVSILREQDATQVYKPPILNAVQQESLEYHISAAEFSRETNRRLQALFHYRKALQIDSMNPEIRSVIKELEAQGD